MANGRFLLWLRNTLKLNTVPGYSADYDKTRGDSVFVDNANLTMEVNNLQEGLTTTEYHGQKASVLDGIGQYWGRTLPQDQANFNPATISSGNPPTGWVEIGAPTNCTYTTIEPGSSGCAKVDISATQNGIMKVGFLTIGKKYKFVIRYKSTGNLRVGRESNNAAYQGLSGTTQWNTVIRTFTATGSDLIIVFDTNNGTSTGTFWIESLTIAEDHKLDLNEPFELIKHSINRDFETTLGAELWTNTTFTDSNADGLANGLEHYNVKTTEITQILTDSDGLHQSIVGSVDTRMLIKPVALSSSSKHIVTLSYKSTGTIEFIVGNINGGLYSKFILPASPTKKTVSFYNYIDGKIGTGGIWFDMSNRTFQIYSISIREIPNLVINGTLTDPVTQWTLTNVTLADGLAKFTDVAHVTAYISQTRTLMIGKKYRVTFEIKNYTSGAVNIRMGNTYGTAKSANGVHTQEVIADDTTFRIYSWTPGGENTTLDVDNIHIYEIPDWTPNVSSVSNNHSANITLIDKQGTTGLASCKVTAGGAGRGGEVLTNGDITGGATGWNLVGTVVYGTNNFICTNFDTSSLDNSALLTIGKTYEVIYTITRTAGSIKCRLGTGNAGTARTASGTYREIQTCTTTNKLFFDGTGFYGTIESVSVKEYLGEITLPSSNFETLVAGNKYTKELWAKVDPTSLTWGSNLLTGDNSTFDSGIGSWLFGAGSFTASGGYGILSAAGAQTYIYRTVTSANKFLKVTLRAKSDTYVGRLRVYHNQGNAPYIAHTGNLTSSWQTFTLYINSWPTAQTFYIQLESNHTGDVHIDDLSIQQADMLNITTQIGTKSITTSTMTVGIYSKSVLNFEASSSEVNQDIRLFLSGVGSVFVESLSLTQKYDYAVAQLIKPVNNAVFKYSFGQASALFGGLNIYVTSGNELNIRSYDNYGVYIQSSAGIVSNNWQSVIVTKDHENQKLYLDNVLKDTDAISSLGKAAIGNFIIGWAIDGGGTRYLGLVGTTLIIRFNNISQCNFNPSNYKIGDTITGGGAEIVLWQDWSNVSGGIANDKYRPETTVRNDLVAYGTPLASDNIVTIKDYSPQTKKLIQGTKTKQPVYSSTNGFDFDGTDDILEAPQTLGNVKTIVLKLKADNLEVQQDILQLNGSAKVTLGTDGVITATGWTSPTITIQDTLLQVSATIAANTEYLIAVRSNTAIDATAFKLGGSTTFFNGKIKKVAVFNTTLDDPTVQKIFKSIRSI